jgi:thiol-disulfide isomerase/thioredoxin
LILLPSLTAAAQLRIALPSATEVEVSVYEGQGAATIFWLPSERGFNAAYREHAQALAGLGHPVWLVDLHETYFVPTGRASIGRFPLDDIVAIIDAAATASGGRLILVSGSRGAQLALIAAREWQLRNPGNSSIRGIILEHAHLLDAPPVAGEKADYLPIVKATNLPVYLVAAEFSTKFSRLQELARELRGNGATVYTQVLEGVQGGFITREDEQSNEIDSAAKRAYAATLHRAAGLLLQVTPPRMAVQSTADTHRFGEVAGTEPVLAAVARPMPAPDLRLFDFNGAPFALDAHRGQVVLVNFWASWCRPCVAEIPSLHRLEAALEDTAFKIVTVNVGEDRARVGRFLQKVSVELPVLMDYDAAISEDWMIYVYPSSYLVDHQGIIRYAYLGALQWDSAENIEIIRQMLNWR